MKTKDGDPAWEGARQKIRAFLAGFTDRFDMQVGPGGSYNFRRFPKEPWSSLSKEGVVDWKGGRLLPKTDNTPTPAVITRRTTRKK